MNTYKAPLADIRFALYDVLDSEALFARLGFADASRELIEAAAKDEPNAAKFLEGLAVRKVIIVPGKIVNIVAG